jgi:hypothetical protein
MCLWFYIRACSSPILSGGCERRASRSACPPRVALRRALAEWIIAKQRFARDLRLQLGDEEHEEDSDRYSSYRSVKYTHLEKNSDSASSCHPAHQCKPSTGWWRGPWFYSTTRSSY